MFQENRDYSLFLQQFATYFQPILDTLAFNLLENHAHFIAQVKDRMALLEQLDAIPKNHKTQAMNKVLNDTMNDNLIDQMIHRQVNSFMTSYVNRKNQNTDRKGGLFQSPFRRSFITSDGHLCQAIIYVHANAQKHGIVKDFKQHTYSSYHEILSGYSTNVHVSKVLNFFGGRDRFVELHERQVEHFYSGLLY